MLVFSAHNRIGMGDPTWTELISGPVLDKMTSMRLLCYQVLGK